MINVNATIIHQIILFLVLIFILNRLMFRPIMNIIADRSRHIEDRAKQLANLKEETEELVNKCVSMERDARKEAGENSSQLRREANEFAEKLFSDTRDEVSEIKAAAVKEVEAKLKEAREALKIEAEKLADELTLKVVGRRFAS